MIVFNRAHKNLIVVGVAFLIAFLQVLLFSSWVTCAPYRWDGGHACEGWNNTTTRAYFAEGTTRNGFEEYLILRNPGKQKIDVDITYSFPPPQAEESQRITLEPSAGTSILVNDVVGHGKDVSICVNSPQGVIAERQMYFNYLGVWTGGHVSRGVESPEERWYFAEGTTRSGFHEWLCVQNPQGEPVNLNFTFLLENGEKVHRGAVLSAKSRYTEDVRSIVGLEHDVSVVIDADKPVVAERPMYFDYKSSCRGGHVSAGSNSLSREWFFAEGTTRSGFEEWLCIENPGTDTSVKVTYIFGEGPPLISNYFLRGGSRTTISVNSQAGPERDVSIKVESEGEILCERPMYFLYHGEIEGGSVLVGLKGGSNLWQFATAGTGDGFYSWLCIANPSDKQADVLVCISGEGGDEREVRAGVQPFKRITFDLNRLCEGLTNPWLSVKSESQVLVERPSYFTYEPKVEPDPFAIAAWNDVSIMSPIRYCDYLGAVFHEASVYGSEGKPDYAQALQPLGLCMRDDNPSRRHPGVSYNVYGEAAYFIEETRGRGTYSTTACDVQSKAGAEVCAPVSGVVIAAEGYMLYGKYPDLRVRIAFDNHPGYHIAILHMSSISVVKGERVEAGKTVIGVVRDLVPYFSSGPNPYTREEGNHVHIQINYRPDIHL